MTSEIVLATGSYDGIIRFWKAAEQKCIAQIDFDTTVCGLAISPNRQFIAGCGLNSLRVFRVDNQLQQTFLRPDQDQCCFSQVLFSKAGDYIFGASEDGSLKAFETRQLSQAFSYKNKAVINSVASFDSYVIFGDQNGRLTQLDIRSPKQPVNIIQAFDLDIGVRYVSYQNKRLVCCDSRGILQLYDTTSMSQLQSIQGHSDQIHKAKLSPDATQLVSTGADRTVKLWSLKSDKLVKTAQMGVENCCLDVDWNSTGQFLLVGVDKCPKLFTAGNGTFDIVKQYGGHGKFVTAVALAD
ncbi:G_beta-like protein GBL [Hexamita inflata]|uniref:G beta-like protein GBL n=1 Tax=Hexamita inflata TaxID=28002 RepID=A0AA86PSR5_9EUKA|nr:G beta-like protein GBL [Hexamita inflata]CAI9949473.1 G beta-like protein GBL [Hexamita inflata]CAI9963557.1 G beta-like protein GBL [Hexamita inflata]